MRQRVLFLSHGRYLISSTCDARQVLHRANQYALALSAQLKRLVKCSNLPAEKPPKIEIVSFKKFIFVFQDDILKRMKVVLFFTG